MNMYLATNACRGNEDYYSLASGNKPESFSNLDGDIDQVPRPMIRGPELISQRNIHSR